MTLRHCHLFTLLACILLCGCPGPSEDISPTDTVRIYFKKVQKDANYKGRFAIDKVDVSPFGESAFILISYYKTICPPIAARLIFTHEREFVDLNFENLHAVSLKEFPNPMTPEQRKAFIAEFSNLLWTGNVIGSVSDIPSYKAGSLPPKVEKAIILPNYTGDLVTAHTFASLGGRVSRFRFAFTPEGRLADIGHVELAKEIGLTTGLK